MNVTSPSRQKGSFRLDDVRLEETSVGKVNPRVLAEAVVVHPELLKKRDDYLNRDHSYCIGRPCPDHNPPCRPYY